MCNFYMSVAARTLVREDPSLRYTIAYCWDVKQATNQQTNDCSCRFSPGPLLRAVGR